MVLRRAQGGDAVYNGSKFDEFSLNVWVNPSRISLYDIRLRAQNRNAHGNVQWLYGKDGITTFDRQTLFLVSGLSSAELVSLGGDDVRDVFDVVKFSEAPQITVGGLMRNPRNNPGALPDVFNVSGFAPGETHIETAVLKNLRFSARSDKATTRVDNASFDFCGGHADGNIAIKKENGKTLFEASAMAEKMNQTEFAEFLMSLDTSKESGETEPPAARRGRFKRRWRGRFSRRRRKRAGGLVPQFEGGYWRHSPFEGVGFCERPKPEPYAP